MGWCSNLLSSLTLIALLLAYAFAGRIAKCILYLPLNGISFMIYFRIRSFIGRRHLSVVTNVLSRLIKFAVGGLLTYTTASLTSAKCAHGPLVLGGILLSIDLIRAYLYESSKRNFENKILTGNFMDILKLEKYIIHSVEGPQSADLERNLSVDEYFNRGRPKPIEANGLFDLWNDQNPYEEHASDSDFIESNVGSKKKVRRQRISIDPETYGFASEKGRPPRDILRIEKVVLTPEEKRKERMYAMNPSEMMPGMDCKPEIDWKDISGEEWGFLEIDKKRTKKIPARPGLITIESLRTQFGEKNAKEAYSLIAFKRGEGINYDVFKENWRQINGERDNLYKTIMDNRRLLNVIWFILVLLESIIGYLMISMYFKTQPLLLELIFPMVILPALPIVKMTVESFLFIIYTHPYDPGDRVHIDGENMVVRRISLFSTVLETWDGMETIIPNLVIREKAILNIRRSKQQQWRLSLLVSSRTPERKIELLREAIKRFVRHDKSYITASVSLSEIVDCNHLRLTVIVKHSINFQSGFFMWTAHTKFVNMVLAIMCKLDIRFAPLGKEIVNLGPTYEHANYEK
ncbi:hypothetical protein EHEL_011140 [Encephalitozoon hellem ATCC 50504]|uniref:Mechanosensitive channel protein n=1 Tax=Encephalitozoon hellem TaxID=27973 RepID=A0A9Q9F7I3_ENCHE|nr:uncharacterized protein EHEL_011140 [Encephalitozoon hellem ATCC 50504]AEI69231.1 hypothetical protein EHEL_011140 [Encephalitozoon hellem ATCC 50504]UTX42429.1 mechanosensitive ion channel protein [Encephalitozoon hellem]WEL37872.1 mechanosensitive channel protein [Encephalitozoon hellem]|eukprot:XP_003886718.1 hypothetical protein EHEL_011140 [Encephalitozoon hellem ATCC 50504]